MFSVLTLFVLFMIVIATKTTKEETRTTTKRKAPKQQKINKQTSNDGSRLGPKLPQSFKQQQLQGDCNRRGKVEDEYATHYNLDVSSQQKFYRDCKHFFTNKADFTFASKLSARLSLYKEAQIVIFIVGLNEGKLLESYLQFTQNIIVHSFDIQEHFVLMARKKYGKENNSLVFNHLGFSNSFGVVEIGGNGEVAGLYNQAAAEEFMKTKHGWKWPKHNETRKVNITTAIQYTRDHRLARVDYMVIDAEGHESHIIEGMQLHDDQNKMKFGAFQYELGIRDNDPRIPKNSMNQYNLSRYLVSLNYTLYLLGQKTFLKLSPEFFLSSEIIPVPVGEPSTAEIEILGNVLAIHPLYGHPIMKSWVNL